MSWPNEIKRNMGKHSLQAFFFNWAYKKKKKKNQFPKANTSHSVKTITWVCLFYIIERCWRESLDAKTSLSCLTTLAHVLNEKVMALKRCLCKWRLVDAGPCPLTQHFKEPCCVLHKPFFVFAEKHIQRRLLLENILKKRCVLSSTLFISHLFTRLLTACQSS